MTWYICAVAWLYHLAHVSPPFCEMIDALVAGQRNDLGVVGIDEDVLVIVATRRSAQPVHVLPASVDFQVTTLAT